MAKMNDIRFLARETAKEVSGSPRDWMRYLDTASRLYRYPFSDTLLIHAQRPDATACAELEVWNEKMRRWVNRGAKGIALIDDTGPRRVLRYVFDVSDTHPVRGGRTPYLWRLKEDQREMLLNHLTDTYGLNGEDAPDLPSALRQVAEDMAADSLEEAMDGMEICHPRYVSGGIGRGYDPGGVPYPSGKQRLLYPGTALWTGAGEIPGGSGFLWDHGL
ncbi:MAG: hypothetical protein ACLRT5_12520 [Lachnospiraceae bacterium]